MCKIAGVALDALPSRMKNTSSLSDTLANVRRRSMEVLAAITKSTTSSLIELACSYIFRSRGIILSRMMSVGTRFSSIAGVSLEERADWCIHRLGWPQLKYNLKSGKQALIVIVRVYRDHPLQNHSNDLFHTSRQLVPSLAADLSKIH
jgi:hypothetical protein